jgi:hypothetical protein
VSPALLIYLKASQMFLCIGRLRATACLFYNMLFSWKIMEDGGCFYIICPTCKSKPSVSLFSLLWQFFTCGWIFHCLNAIWFLTKVHVKSMKIDSISQNGKTSSCPSLHRSRQLSVCSGEGFTPTSHTSDNGTYLSICG